MKHIQMLAEFRTGMPVRIGHPNEHLAENTNKDLASPMYSTGIGLVIEGINRAELSEMLEHEKASKTPIEKSIIVPEETEIVVAASVKPETKTKGTKKGTKFDFTKIIDTFGKIFTSDDIK